VVGGKAGKAHFPRARAVWERWCGLPAGTHSMNKSRSKALFIDRW